MPVAEWGRVRFLYSPYRVDNASRARSVLWQARRPRPRFTNAPCPHVDTAPHRAILGKLGGTRPLPLFVLFAASKGGFAGSKPHSAVCL